MSYLVLARKWRPQIFEEVVGQQHITRTLQNAITQNRVAHAFLFAGARGVGKTSTARILAKALNCELGPRIDPCNRCSSCREISSGTSMDVIEIDGASNRGIEEIRELRESLRYTPAKSRYRVFIIDEVHMLTREAFNALLKTLEEPPAHIIFVFATTEPHKVPATILSRCQRYDFKRIPLRTIVESLEKIAEQEKFRISRRGLLMIARESEGSMRDAQSLLDQVVSYAGSEVRDEDIIQVLGIADQKLICDTLEAIAERDGAKCLELVDQVYQFGYDIQYFCRELLQFLRHMMLIKVIPRPEQFIDLPGEDIDTLRGLADKFSFDHLSNLFNLLLRGEQEMSQSVFPRTMLEVTLLRMATAQPVIPVDEILRKLDELKGRSPGLPNGAATREEKPIQEQAQIGEVSSSCERPIGNDDSKPTAPDAPPSAAKEEAEARNDYEEVWKELIDFTRRRNPVLGSFLAFGSIVEMDGRGIEIGFEKDSFHYERMLDPENRTQLEKIVRDFFCKEMELIISPTSRKEKSKNRVFVSEYYGPVQDTARSKEKKIEEHPIVQEALRIFEGRIVEK